MSASKDKDGSGGVVNLRQARKRRARAAARKEADANAVRHGLPKDERKRQEAEAERVVRLHEAHRRERPDDDG